MHLLYLLGDIIQYFKETMAHTAHTSWRDETLPTFPGKLCGIWESASPNPSGDLGRDGGVTAGLGGPVDLLVDAEPATKDEWTLDAKVI